MLKKFKNHQQKSAMLQRKLGEGDTELTLEMDQKVLLNMSWVAQA